MTLRILLLLRHKAKIKLLLRLLAERERQVPHARRLEELLPRDEARRLGRERVEVRRAEVAPRDALRRVLVDALGQGLRAAHHPRAAVVEDVALMGRSSPRRRRDRRLRAHAALQPVAESGQPPRHTAPTFGVYCAVF